MRHSRPSWSSLAFLGEETQAGPTNRLPGDVVGAARALDAASRERRTAETTLDAQQSILRSLTAPPRRGANSGRVVYNIGFRAQQLRKIAIDEQKPKVERAQAALASAQVNETRAQEALARAQKTDDVLTASVDIATAIQDGLESEAAIIISGLEAQNAALELIMMELPEKPERKKEAVEKYNLLARSLTELQRICNAMAANADGAAYAGGMPVETRSDVAGLAGWNPFKDVADFLKKATDPITKPLSSLAKKITKNPLRLLNPVAFVKDLYVLQRDVIGEAKKSGEWLRSEVQDNIKKAIGKRAYDFASNIAQKATPYVLIVAGIVLTLATAGAGAGIAATAVTIVGGGGAVAEQAVKDLAIKNQEDAMDDEKRRLRDILARRERDAQAQAQRQDLEPGDATDSVYSDRQNGNAYGWYDRFSCWVGYCPVQA